MTDDAQGPPQGPTVGRVDNDQDTQERVLGEHLEYLKGRVLVYLAQVRRLEAAILPAKDAGRYLERRAFGVLLALGKTEKEAREEIASWQHTRERL